MKKTLKRVTNMTRSNREKQSEGIDPLQNIAGIAYDMELHIEDVIGITRTAQERSQDSELENEDCAAALGLIMYRLEQIQEGHELIAKNAPYRDYVPGEEGRPA